MKKYKNELILVGSIIVSIVILVSIHRDVFTIDATNWRFTDVLLCMGIDLGILYILNKKQIK